MDAPALLPAATFPPLAWFHLAQHPQARVCVHEHYIKQSVRNRIALVNSQGPASVTLPVSRRTAPSRGVQHLFFTEKTNPNLILKALRTNCGSAPFFEHYYPDVEEWAHSYALPGHSWLEAALASTQWVCAAVGWSHPESTSAYHDGTSWDDWRPKSRWKTLSTPRYPQVFEDRLGFVPGRSILDVLFHLGPETPSLPSPHGNFHSASHSPS